ncbi:MAG: HypC/HybG/HupF family hydrogenase formation chaperone [Micromonosporaceae bacterium]
MRQLPAVPSIGEGPGGPPVQSAPRIPACRDDVCVTCSDEAVEVLVTKLLDDAFAMVDTGLSRELVSVALVDVAVGDTVLVHAKEAIGVVRRAGL